MDSIVGKVNINVLLLQTILHYKWGHAVMDDIVYRTMKCALILTMFYLRIQDSIFVSYVVM